MVLVASHTSGSTQARQDTDDRRETLLRAPGQVQHFAENHNPSDLRKQPVGSRKLLTPETGQNIQEEE